MNEITQNTFGNLKNIYGDNASDFSDVMAQQSVLYQNTLG